MCARGRSGSVRLVASATLLALLLAVAVCESKYVGYKILRVSPRNDQEIKVLNELPSLDIHRGELRQNELSEIMLSPTDFDSLQKTLPTLSMEVKEENVQALIDKHMNEVAEVEDRWARGDASVAREASFFDTYHKLAEVDQYIATLIQQYPNLISREKIGESYEKREIYVLVVTNKTADSRQKRQVLFNSGQHAREWLAPSTVLYSLTQLLLGKDDPKINALLNQLEFHFIPFVNPDGYEYSHTERLWRKNRRLNSPGIYGVDTNRNWGKGFGVGSASLSPASETYEGKHPFSEPETQSVAVYIKSKNFRAHVDFHTFGRDILRRWASSTSLSLDDSVMKEAGDAARAAIIAAGGASYRSANGYVLGIDGGCMPDWTYDTMGMISYTVELSDDSFIRPPSDILPVGKEGYAVIRTLAKFVADGKADIDKMKWKKPATSTTGTPPPPIPHGDGTPTTPTSVFSTADLLMVFVVLFVGAVVITAIIVAVKQYYAPRTPLGALVLEDDEEEGETSQWEDADQVVDDNEEEEDGGQEKENGDLDGSDQELVEMKNKTRN